MKGMILGSEPDPKKWPLRPGPTGGLSIGPTHAVTVPRIQAAAGCADRPVARQVIRSSGDLLRTRVAVFEDYDQITRLQIRNGLVVRSYEDWLSLWSQPRAATSCSWAVDARYRSYSLRIMSCLMKQKEIDLFACTTVSSASEPSYRDAFRFSKASAGTWDNASFWITNYRGFSKSA